MGKSFLAVVALGALIGLLLPSERAAETSQAAPVVTATASKPSAPAAPPQSWPGTPKETLLERAPDGHFYTHAEVNGQLVRFLIDTGASGVALTVQDAQRVGVPFMNSEFDIIGSGASGPVRGKAVTFDKVSLDGKDAREVRGAVVEGLGISLLGQAYLGRLSVEMNGEHMRIR